MAEAAGGSTPTTFYRQVMNFTDSRGKPPPVRSNIPPPETRQPEEIMKGEFVKYLKLAVFRVTEVIDDPDSQERKFFKEHLYRLTKKELRELQKKINAIADSLIDDYEDADEFEQMRHLAANAINHKLKQSSVITRDLQKKIHERLRSIDNIKPHDSEQSYKVTAGSSHALDISDFAYHYFKDIIETFDKLVEEGEVVPSHGSEDGHTFVKVYLIDKLFKAM